MNDRAHDTADRPGAALAERLREEMRVRFADVPGHLPEGRHIADDFELAASAFLFTTNSGIRFHYELGQGITAALPEGTEDTDFKLFLWGTVFGAVAWLNGFFALHASAVARDGRVFAFTADSGAGKSTLAAALAQRGFDHFCDDTLVLAPGPREVLAIPDGKPLKLWDDAFALTSAEREEAIASVPGKFYARASSGTSRTLPLTDLVFLERGDDVRLEPIEGTRKLQLLTQAIYRGYVHAAFNDAGSHARTLIEITANVRFWNLARPFDPNLFDRAMDRITESLMRMVDAGG